VCWLVCIALLFLDPFGKKTGFAATGTELDGVLNVEGILLRGGIWGVVFGWGHVGVVKGRGSKQRHSIKNWLGYSGHEAVKNKRLT
jgi:hypothetical protein